MYIHNVNKNLDYLNLIYINKEMSSYHIFKLNLVVKTLF